MVNPSRHSEGSLSWITDSIIVSGAGSVAVSARPILPKTILTSGTVRISLSVCCNSCCALPIEIPGKVVGMYIRSPSFKSGMNSEPNLVAGQRPTINRPAATISTITGLRVTTLIIGRYIQIIKRFNGLVCSGLILPRMKYPINTGTSVMDSKAAPAIE